MCCYPAFKIDSAAYVDFLINQIPYLIPMRHRKNKWGESGSGFLVNPEPVRAAILSSMDGKSRMLIIRQLSLNC